jgi:hypothetical protein
MRGMMRSLEVSRAAKTLLKVCVWVYLYMGFVGLHFKRAYLDFWELRKTATVH